ncbi:MAG: hypothetical protein E6J90_25840 [Deltaproteobacteria bacterium]|nr:MAG: hypothetical protein E6J90_25840 [Deltaproteobacteria bacterium]
MTTDAIDMSAPPTHDEVMAKLEKLVAQMPDPRAPKLKDPATAVALDAWGERLITYLRIWDLRISSVLSRIESCELRTLQRIGKAEQQIRADLPRRSKATRGRATRKRVTRRQTTRGRKPRSRSSREPRSVADPAEADRGRDVRGKQR